MERGGLTETSKMFLETPMLSVFSVEVWVNRKKIASFCGFKDNRGEDNLKLSRKGKNERFFGKLSKKYVPNLAFL